MAYKWPCFSSSSLIYLTKVFLCVCFPTVSFAVTLAGSGGEKEGTHHARVFTITEDADISQTQFHEALVYKVHRRMDVQSHRCLSKQLGCESCNVHKWTYRVNISCEVGRIRTPVIRVVNGRHLSHETQVRTLVCQLIEGEFQIWCRYQPDQHAISENGQAAIDLASSVQTFEFASQAHGRNER